MCLELTTANRKRHIAELLIVKQIAQVLRQLTFWHFKLYYVALSWYVYTVSHHTDLQVGIDVAMGREKKRKRKENV